MLPYGPDPTSGHITAESPTGQEQSPNAHKPLLYDPFTNSQSPPEDYKLPPKGKRQAKLTQSPIRHRRLS
ncbi:hypothetical protein FRC08_013023 [Ceratobasidium sp. 394]|nr:hypothetical protein FRC08_013023 [Ceratobasidium sp. 394]